MAEYTDAENKSLRGVVMVVLAVFAVTIAVYQRVITPKLDPREPPLLRPKIPIIGHMLGIMQYGVDYYEKIHKTTKYPIFTLPFLSTKTYTVASPSLAVLAQKSQPGLNFYKPILPFIRAMSGIKDADYALITDEYASSTETAYVTQIETGPHKSLLPGPALDAHALHALPAMTQRIAAELPRGADPAQIDILAVLRSATAHATLCAYMGLDQPITNSESLQRDLWTWLDGLLALAAREIALGGLGAGKLRAARERLVAAMLGFLRAGGADEAGSASELMKGRIRAHRDRGMDEDFMSRVELTFIFAQVGNAVHAAGWLVSYLFAEPKLLAAVRKEVEASAVAVYGNTRTVSAAALRKPGSLISASFREVLRRHMRLSAVRYVTKDFMLGDYLLKKDSILLISTQLIHRDDRVWGDDVRDFNPYRFIESSNGVAIDNKTGKEKSVHPAASRYFGGGTRICPGRHFAQIEVLTVAAAIVAGWDMGAGPDGTETISIPKVDKAYVAMSMDQSTAPFVVTMRRRRGLEDANWVLGL